MILAIDTSSANCSVALLSAEGQLLASRDEVIGRGHAEHLAPLVQQILDGRLPSVIAVGVGPGSFTGIRVGLAAAQGLAIGWSVPIHGVNSLALLAAAAPSNLGNPGGRDSVAAVTGGRDIIAAVTGGRDIIAAVTGGHGELFVQRFRAGSLEPLGPAENVSPAVAAAGAGDAVLVGSGVAAMVAAGAIGEPIEACPSAARLSRLPEALRTLAARPHYGRAPDARPAAA